MNNNNPGSPVENLLVYLNLQNNLSAIFNATILSMLPTRTLEKAELVTNKDDIALTAFWIDTGYARAFQNMLDKEGLPIEVTVDFNKPKRIMVIAESFFNGLPCDYNVEVAKASVIVEFTRTSFDALKLAAPEAEALANNILAKERTDALEKMRMLRMKPRPRYREFLRLFTAEIHLYFDVKDIASYLGMTPAFLSRLRAEK
jgi:CRP-like cAMP-binding protein